MIKTSSFKPGRVYSVVYSSTVDMVGKREFSAEAIASNPILSGLFSSQYPQESKPITCKLENPIHALSVSVRRVSTVQAAGAKTWANFKAKNGIETESNRKPWYRESDENSCIVVHIKEGTTYLRGLPRGITKEEYHIGNAPIDEETLALVRVFKKSRPEAQFVTLRLDNLENVLDETGESE